MTTDGDTLAKLRDCLADLEGYVTRRATELAAPLIEIAQADAAALVRAAEFEAQRQIDLVRELRKRLAVFEQIRVREQDARGRLAALLGGYPVATNPAGLPPLEVLVTDVETRLAEKDSMIERLRSGGTDHEQSPLSALFDPPDVPQ